MAEQRRPRHRLRAAHTEAPGHRGPSCTARPQAALRWAPPSDLTRLSGDCVTTTHTCPRHAHNTLMHRHVCTHLPCARTHTGTHRVYSHTHTHTPLTRFHRHKLTRPHTGTRRVRAPCGCATQPHTLADTHTLTYPHSLKCTVVQSYTRSHPHTDSYTLPHVFAHVHPHSHTYVWPKYVHTHSHTSDTLDLQTLSWPAV